MGSGYHFGSGSHNSLMNALGRTFPRWRLLAVSRPKACSISKRWGGRPPTARPDCPAALIVGEIVSALNGGHYGVAGGASNEAALVG